jgi:hypothetical protein
MTQPLPTDSLDCGQDWPRTLQDAVDYLIRTLPQAEKERLAAVSKIDLIEVGFFGLGAHIRKVCGLWQGNQTLMASCGALNPEDATTVIIQELWARLRH